MDRPWSPRSWREFPIAAMQTDYGEPGQLTRTLEKLASLPPLVTSFEIDRLKQHLAAAERGERFVLQGGDCAETLDECRSDVITSKIKILLQMSLVLVQGTRHPVVRIGRFAGQYAKPRSQLTEKRGDVELPSYFGDLVNGSDFTPEARRPDPERMVSGYQHAALTLNFIRSLSDGGFADLHHPEYWDLRFLDRAGLPAALRSRYEGIIESVGQALRFMEVLSENPVEELTRVDFFTSHEGLNLYYEEAQTRVVPRRPHHYDLTTHLPWIGERTRALDGAHVEYFRGIANPVGVKLGPSLESGDLLRLIERLNPQNESGKLVLIARAGAEKIRGVLPAWVEAVKREGRHVLWLSDPMHGNTRTTTSGHKTRLFEDVLSELQGNFDVHQSLGSRLGGVHFELTGEDVTECVGAGVTEADLDLRYASLCDPRLNYAQALEMAFRLADLVAAQGARRPVL